MAESPARDLGRKELSAFSRAGAAEAVPGTIPILGLARHCHGVDCATRPGAAALQNGETVAPWDGACCSQETHRSGHPTPPLHLTPRAHTYCTTALLPFNTIAADTCSLPMAGLDWVIFKATSNTNLSVTGSMFLLWY